MQRPPAPALAGVRSGPSGHFISILSFEGDRYTVGDPLAGKAEFSRDEFLEAYDFTGFFMIVSRPDPGRDE